MSTLTRTTARRVIVWLQSRSLPARGRVGLEVHRRLCITDAGNAFISTAMDPGIIGALQDLCARAQGGFNSATKQPHAAPQSELRESHSAERCLGTPQSPRLHVCHGRRAVALIEPPFNRAPPETMAARVHGR
jgi:hypothetical protein